MTNYRFLSEQDQQALTAWWHWLDDNRGERAQLRRAQSPDDILLTAAFAKFLQHMPGYWGVASGEKGIWLSDAAMIAGVLARVKDASSASSFAQALATPKEKGGKAVMSELRFQQLQKSRDEQEFFTRLCRAIALLGGTANILSLAESILHWLERVSLCSRTPTTGQISCEMGNRLLRSV